MKSPNKSETRAKPSKNNQRTLEKLPLLFINISVSMTNFDSSCRDQKRRQGEMWRLENIKTPEKRQSGPWTRGLSGVAAAALPTSALFTDLQLYSIKQRVTAPKVQPNPSFRRPWSPGEKTTEPETAAALKRLLLSSNAPEQLSVPPVRPLSPPRGPGASLVVFLLFLGDFCFSSYVS